MGRDQVVQRRKGLQPCRLVIGARVVSIAGDPGCCGLYVRRRGGGPSFWAAGLDDGCRAGRPGCGELRRELPNRTAARADQRDRVTTERGRIRRAVLPSLRHEHHPPARPRRAKRSDAHESGGSPDAGTSPATGVDRDRFRPAVPRSDAVLLERRRSGSPASVSPMTSSSAIFSRRRPTRSGSLTSPTSEAGRAGSTSQSSSTASAAASSASRARTTCAPSSSSTHSSKHYSADGRKAG